MPKTKTRRIKEIEEGGLPENLAYCRRCMDVKSKNYFHGAVNHDLDRNHCLSFCKSCVDEMFAGFLASEGSLEKAVLKLCRIVDLKYIPEAIEAAKKQALAKGVDQDKIFGYYKSKVLAVEKTSTTDSFENLDLSFQDSIQIIVPNDNPTEYDPEEIKNLSLFWGNNFEPEELEILESKYAEWSQSHSIDTQSERILLKYICLKEYEIDRAVQSSSSTASLMKEFQELLKTSGLNPSAATLAAGGKAQETWGNFIKMIEENEPAEYYKDDDLFKDYDNIKWIWENFVVRSIKNFITGSRDFTLQDIDENYEIEDSSDADEIVVPELEYKVEE